MTAPRRLGALAAAALLLAVTATWLNPAPASACGCVHDADDPELVRRAEVAFTGTVTGDRAFGSTRTYTFAVDQVFSGEVRATQRVQTNLGSAACELELTGAGPFLVLGYTQDGALRASSCGGTRSAAAIPGELGPGRPPTPGPRSRRPLVGGATALLGAAGVGLALVLVRRRSARPEG